ncbi:MAG: hypothetical protein GY755_13630 [Chloroflexi bacterium]|nr:hypothetical protein [Chloroflexota bacterium]
MANAEEKILDIRVNYDDAIRKIAEYRTQLDVLKKVEQTLKEDVKEGRISREKANIKLSEAKIATKEYTDSIRVLTKEIDNNRKTEKEQEGSLKSLRSELSSLTSAYDSLSRVEREGAKGQEMANKIRAVSEELKTAEEETNRFQRSVGSYEKAINSAISANVPIIGQLKGMTEATGGLSASLVAGAQAVKAFSVQLLALLANPVVAILAAIAVAVMVVAKAINSSEEASNRWNVIIAPLTRALNFLLSVIQFLAGGILSVVEQGAKMLNWLSSMAEKLPIVGDSIKKVNDANREGIEIAKEKIKIEQQSRKDEVQNAKDALTVAELRTKAKDKEKYTSEERLKFIRQAGDLEKEQADRNVKLAERRFAALKKESEWAENNAETNKELARLEADVFRARKEYFDKTRELKEQENTLAAESAAAAKAAIDKQKEAAAKSREIRDKEVEEIRKAQDEMFKILKDGADKQKLVTEAQYSRQIDDLKKRLKEEEGLTEKAKEAINAQIKAIEQQRSNDVQKLSEESIRKELDNQTKLTETRLASVKSGSEQEFQLRMQLLQQQRDAELSNSELTEQMKLAIKDKYNKEMDDLSIKHEKDLFTKQQEEVRIQFETQIAQSYGNQEEILRIKAEQKKAELDSLQQMEGESLEAFNLRKLEIENQYKDARKEIADQEVQTEQQKFEAMAAVTGALSQLAEAAGEQSKELAMASKVLALAEIAINTGKAIAAGVAQAQSVPFPGNIAAIATTVATVLSNIAIATKTVKSAKFATGGYVSGVGTESSDSIPAQLSNGESVINARSTDMFAPILSAMNVAGGGVPINVQSTSNQTIGEDMLARAVAKGVMMAPPPVLSVEEYTTVSNRVRYVENLGDL